MQSSSREADRWAEAGRLKVLGCLGGTVGTPIISICLSEAALTARSTQTAFPLAVATLLALATLLGLERRLC